MRRHFVTLDIWTINEKSRGTHEEILLHLLAPPILHTRSWEVVRVLPIMAGTVSVFVLRKLSHKQLHAAALWVF